MPNKLPQLGYSYGEYHYHGGGGGGSSTIIYIPPTTPTPTPLEMNITAEYDLDEESCTYEVTAKWDEPMSYSQYSVSAVKTASDTCLDPGPKADTTTNEYLFMNLRSGRYLINVKPGYSSRWDHFYYCSELELPAVKPKIQAKAITDGSDKFITYTTTCASSIKVDNGVGYLTAKQGKFKVNATGTTDYRLTATSSDGKMQEIFVQVTDVTPTPTITPTQEVKGMEANALPESHGFFSWLLGLFKF